MNQDPQPTMLICRCFIRNDQDQILCLQRHPNSRYSPSLWEMPGGKADPGEDEIQALHREIMEETGLTIRLDDGIVHQESHLIPDGPRQGQIYRGLFMSGEVIAGQLVLSQDHSAAQWLSLAQLQDLAGQLSDSTRRALHQLTLDS